MGLLQKFLQPNKVIWLLLGGAFLIRLYFILNHQGMWGVDGGAYLLSRNSVLGDEPTGTDFPRPPFAPGWLLVPFTYLFGDDYGLRYFALFMSFVAFPPFLLFASQLFKGWKLVWASGLFLADWMLAEMFTAGVLPMVGFSFIFLALWAIWHLKRNWEWKTATLLAFCLPAITYTNQTSTGLTALVFPAFVLGLGINRAFVRRLLLPVVVGVLLASTAWPWYSNVAFGSGMLRYPGPFIGFYSLSNAGWYQWMLGWLIGFAILLQGKGLIRACAVVTVALASLCPFLSYDESFMNILYRARYLLMPFLALCGIWAISRWWPRFRLNFKPIIQVAFGLAVFSGYLFQLHAETKLGRMVTANTQEAIAWVSQQPGNGAVITNSYSLSLFVSAMTKRKSAWVQVYDPPPAYKVQHELSSTVLGWLPGNGIEAAGKLNASWVLADTIWPSYGKEVANRVEGLGTAYAFVDTLSTWQQGNLGSTWQFEHGLDPWPLTDKNAPWLELVWEKGTTKVWRITG